MDRLHVATLNILNLADRWDERLPLILADMAALQPDVLGLQEAVYVLQQDRLIGAAGAGRYESTRGWAGRPEYGNAMLVEGAAGRGRGRAPRSRAGPVGRAGPDRPRAAAPASSRPSRTSITSRRTRQRATSRRASWSIGWPRRQPPTRSSSSATSTPSPTSRRTPGCGRPAIARRTAEANGTEPEVTWPSGLVGPAIDTDGPPGCLDYIWVQGAISVDDCRLVFDRPAVGDPGLYPSDHLGLAAHLTVG